MLFLTRSAICIGAVALAVAGNLDTPGLKTMATHAGRDAAQSIGAACAASRECVMTGMTLAMAASRSAEVEPTPAASTIATEGRIGGDQHRVAPSRTDVTVSDVKLRKPDRPGAAARMPK